MLINLGRIEEKLNDIKDDHLAHAELSTYKERLKQRIQIKKNNLRNIEIIKDNKNDLLINTDDIIKIKVFYPNNDIEEEIYKLVARDVDYESSIEEVSINSPLGKALYNSSVNDTVYYDVKDKKIKVEILEKVNTKKLIKK